MSALTQIGAVCAMNLRSLPQRMGTSSVVVIGIAGVVAVLISVLAPCRRGWSRHCRPRRPIIARSSCATGANAEIISALTQEETLAIANSAGIKRDSAGRALASPESLMIVNLRKVDGSEKRARRSAA